MRVARTRNAAVLRLAAGMRIEAGPSAELHMLHSAAGTVPLNATAAAILLMCDGRHTRRDVVARLRAHHLHGALRIGHINSFLNAARSLAWITEGDVAAHAHQSHEIH
jgi:hypothetical protein